MNSPRNFIILFLLIVIVVLMSILLWKIKTPTSTFWANVPQGFAFLSSKPCPSGYEPVEDGYIKLGNQNLTLQATGTNERSINHNHDAGDLYAAIVFGGDRSNLGIANERVPANYRSNRSISSLVGEPGPGEENQTSATAVRGVTANHSISFDVEPRHIILRLCVKD